MAKEIARAARVLAVLITAGVSSAPAALLLNLDSSLQYTTGANVLFSGTLTNTGPGDLYLNGTSTTSVLPVDDSPFFSTAPPILLAGATVSGPLFSVMVPGATSLGLYTGTFNILGGAAADDLNVLATETFAVQVVPEPSTWTVAVLALGFLGALKCVREGQQC
jgi:PEP-CTERM motif